MPAGQTFTHGVDAFYTAFVYEIDGTGITDNRPIENGILVLIDTGDHLSLTSGDHGIRVLVLTGKPLNEPVALRGPIVMNTQEELTLAFQ